MAIDVGAKIRARRKQLHFSQTRLSELSGISQSAISDIENPNATKTPNTDTIQKIAKALMCTVSDLMEEHEIAAQDTDLAALAPDEQKLIKDYRSLNKQGQEYIRQTMFMALPIYIRHSDFSGLEEMKQG